MNTTKLVFSSPLLNAEEERELARKIEAGVYATHLVATDDRRHPRSALKRIIENGFHARETLFRANLRLVMKLTGKAVKRTGLPLDDLFQEGCLALGEAIQHFDHTRGTRFSTLAHEYVSRALARSAYTRCGSLDLVRPVARYCSRTWIKRHLTCSPAKVDSMRWNSPPWISLTCWEWVERC